MNLKVDIYPVCRDFNFWGEYWSDLLINITSIGGSCISQKVSRFNSNIYTIKRIYIGLRDL